MKPISTEVHGLLDYSSAATLLMLPRMLGWSRRVTNFLTLMAVVTALYSAFTRYELGLVRRVPMRAHIGIDILNGLTMLLAPAILKPSRFVSTLLFGFGLFEIAAASATDPKEPRPIQGL